MALLHAGDRRHDLSGRAVAALQRVVVDEGLLHRVQDTVRPPTGPRSSSPHSRRPAPPASGRRPTRRPSTCTVQAPHWPWSQPFLAPVRARRSRRRSRSEVRGSMSRTWAPPFTRMRVVTALLVSGFAAVVSEPSADCDVAAETRSDTPPPSVLVLRPSPLGPDVRTNVAKISLIVIASPRSEAARNQNPTSTMRALSGEILSSTLCAAKNKHHSVARRGLGCCAMQPRYIG